MLEAGEHPAAQRAAAAQRHDLPLEPAGLRRRRRHAAPARREPRARRPGRPSSTLMANAAFYFGLVRAPGRERPAAVVADVVPGRRGELPRPRPSTASTPSLYWPGIGEVQATELVLRRLLPMAHEGLASWGVAADESDRLLGIIEQRCLPGVNGAELVRRPDAPTRRARTATTRCGRPCGTTASGCTATSRSTPGTEPAQRRRIRRHSRPAPDRGSRQPCRVTTTKARSDPRSCGGRDRGSEPGRVDVLERQGPGPGDPGPGPGRRAARSTAPTSSVRSPWSQRPVVGHGDGRAAGGADVEHRREVVTVLGGGQGRARPHAAAAGRAVERGRGAAAPGQPVAAPPVTPRGSPQAAPGAAGGGVG